MTAFIIKSAITLGVLLAVYYLFLEREKMHRFNRFYLLGALVLSLGLPFIDIPVYVAVAPQLPNETPFMASMPNAAAVAPAQMINESVSYLPYILAGCYMAIALVLIIRFILNIAHFYRLKNHNTTVQYKGATLILLDDKIVPHTFLKNIYISKKEYESRLIAPEIFTHELTHVRQWHTLDILFTELLKTIFWFNPMLWLYKRAIQLNHEFLADETTVNQHLNIPTYQQMLLDKALPLNSYALASSINFSITKKRFIMMTKTTSKTKGLLLKLAIVPVAAGLIYAISVKTIAQQTPVATGTAVNLKDSTAYRLKRDAYFSGVKVLIDDKANNVYINTRYEKLSEQQKERYYFTVPEGFEMNYIPETEYKKLQNKKGYYVAVDGLPIDNKELLNHTPEEFVYHTMIIKAKESLTKERPQIFEYYLYTLPYYNKHFKNRELKHYPDSIYKMSITKVYKDDKVIAGNARPKKFRKVSDAMDYLGGKGAINYTDVDKMPQYPGGLKKFTALVADNFKAPKSADPAISMYYLTVVIEKDGEMSYAKILNAQDEGTTQEIIRLLKMSETWKPGEINNKPVRTSYTIPVTIN